jgi:hypothetical protein
MDLIFRCAGSGVVPPFAFLIALYSLTLIMCQIVQNLIKM